MIIAYSLIFIGSIMKQVEIETGKPARVIPLPFRADKVYMSIADEIDKRS
jgi:hypothetical protein